MGAIPQNAGASMPRAWRVALRAARHLLVCGARASTWVERAPLRVEQHAPTVERDPTPTHRLSHPPTEVVIAPSALHVGAIRAALREEVKLAVQDIHTAKVRAVLGRVRRCSRATCTGLRALHSIPHPRTPPLSRAWAPTPARTPRSR